jgi:hypothetical protein
MRLTFLRAGYIGLLTFVTLAHAGGSEGTTVPVATPVAPADCTVPMRPFDELRALIVKALPQVMATLDGTPEASPVASPRPALDPSHGIPADAATVRAAEDIVRQVAACTNAGQIGALLSLYDDEGAAAYGAVAYESFAQGVTGGHAPVDTTLLDQFLGSLQLSAPLPEEDRITAFHVDRVSVFPNGLVHVAASFARSDDGLSPFQFWLREEEGHYRIAFDPDENIDILSAGTPTPVAS